MVVQINQLDYHGTRYGKIPLEDEKISSSSIFISNEKIQHMQVQGICNINCLHLNLVFLSSLLPE